MSSTSYEVESPANQLATARLVLGFAVVVLFAGTLLYLGGFSFDPINDEEQFWVQVVAFAASWPPGLDALRSYAEPMTPLAFVYWSGLESLHGLGLMGGRLATLLTSLVALGLIGLRRPAPGADPTAPVLAALALLLYPYWLPISVLLYTDVPAALLLIVGLALHTRGQHLASALAFALAIATRQYLVMIPVALVAHEGFAALRAGNPRWSRWLPYAVSAATLLVWVAFFGGLGPAAGLEKWPRHSNAFLDVEPSYLLYFLATTGAYFVVLEFLLYRRWRTVAWRLDARVGFAIGAVLLFNLVFAPTYDRPIGLGDRGLRFLIGHSAFADAFRAALFVALASATVLRFARLDLGMWIVAAYGAIFPLLWSPWEKYAMPVLAALWFLKSAGVLDPSPRRGSATKRDATPRTHARPAQT